MYKAIRVTREVDLILVLIEDLDQFGTSVQVKTSDFQLNDEGLVVQFNPTKYMMLLNEKSVRHG